MLKLERMAAAAAFGAVSSAGMAASADPVADFYRDKTITVISAGGAGGAHGAYAQMISRRIQAHIPGRPNVIIQYMLGAGGNKAMNYLYNVAARDGTFVGVPLQDLIFNARIGVKAVKYDAKKAEYLGGADVTRTTVTVMKASGIETLADAKRKEVIMASTGKSGQTYIVPTVLNAIMDTKFRVVIGYQGLGLMHLAMEKGEVHGRAASWSSITGTRKAWVEKKMINNLVTIALDREPELPDVPSLADLAKSEGDRALTRLLAGSAALGRAWVAFDIPTDRLAALRSAYAATLADPAIEVEAAKRGLRLQPISWRTQQKIAGDILATPDETVARLKSILGLK